MPTRTARASWQGPFREGSGSFNGESGAVEGTYSVGSRFADAAGSNPEELLAAAEASCFSMALSGNLERNGTPATRVDTEARCTIDKDGDGFSITRMDLIVRAVVPNIEDETFQKIAEETKTTCPVSKALANNVEFSLDAKLEAEIPEQLLASNTATRQGGGTFPNIRR